jgi:mono/diheme cytochrome c family protein
MAVISATGLTLVAQTTIDNNVGADMGPKPPVKARPPAEQAQTFVLPPGYRMELVAAEPDVISPAVIEFDGNGRMYVAEFITYMRDVEGSNQHAPTNRITRFEDTNADGTYDRRTVFVDNLVLPRMILPLDHDSILTNETASDDVVKWTDTNGDGVADKRELFYTGVGVGRDGNLEHEQSGFVWGLDNWIYSTYNSFRFRWTPSGILREPTGANNGQWGLTQDDDGKMWFVCAGCEYGPINFHVPVQYGAFPRLEGEFEDGFRTAWPIVGLGDTQGGMGRVRMPIGVLNHLTAPGGPDIVRGHRVPADLRGDLLFTEPVGRFIRRATIVKDGGFTQLQNAYPGSEFILSSDPIFRPVNIRTAPDGTIYIADMYHGIIQEAQWTGPGSYLRMKILQYQLDKIVDHGRIWRLRFDGIPEVPATPAGPAARPTPAVPAIPAIPLDLTRPRMLSETPAQLVGHLKHPNGWWRDTAQRLLVLRQDRSVVPALQNILRTTAPPARPGAPAGASTSGEGGNLLERFHALWTLEGLGALDPELARVAIRDPNPRMRVQGIRASETLYKAGDRSFADDYRAAAKDTDPDVALQAMLTLNVLKVADARAVIAETLDTHKAKGVQVIGQRLLAIPEDPWAGRGLAPEEVAVLEKGRTTFNEICASCHGDDGRGTPKSGGAPGATMAPPIGGSAHVQGHRDFVIKTLLHGLTGPNNGKTYEEVMIPMGTQTDEWIANVASYVRNSFGNSAGFVTPADVARVRAATRNRKMSWTVAELNATLPALIPVDPNWKATASHNAEQAPRGLVLQGWASGVPQAAGMWYQVELPAPTMVSEIQFDAFAVGGRGGAGAPDGGPAARYPREYQVQISQNGAQWSQPVARGQGSRLTTIAFTPVRATFIRITQTATVPNAPVWSIQNFRVFGPTQ